MSDAPLTQADERWTDTLRWKVIALGEREDGLVALLTGRRDLAGVQELVAASVAHDRLVEVERERDEALATLVKAREAHVGQQAATLEAMLAAEERAAEYREALERIARFRRHALNPDGYWCGCSWCIAMQALGLPYPVEGASGMLSSHPKGTEAADARVDR